MDDIMSGHFSKTMMEDWANDDKNLIRLGELQLGKLLLRKQHRNRCKRFRSKNFLTTDRMLWWRLLRAGVELAFDIDGSSWNYRGVCVLRVVARNAFNCQHHRA